MQITIDENHVCPGKLHRFLLPFSIKFPHLNFAPYVLYIYSCYMKPVHDTNSEPELPVVYLHLPDCKSIVCICLHLKERCMRRKPSRTHFILCLQCLFFLLKKRSFHANPLCMIIHYLENVVSSGGGGWGRAKKTIMAKNWRIFTCNVLSPNLKRRKKVKGH